MNILFLNVGRRCEIVREFKKVLPGIPGGGLVYGSDINPLAPGLSKVDRSVIFPHSSDKSFLEIFIQFCSEHQIKLVVPTIDPDLRYLSKNLTELKKRLPETLILVPDYSIISLTEDKRKTKEFFRENGALVPEYIDSNQEINFPIFVKPARGSASEGALKVNSQSELDAHLQKIEAPMIEELIEGPEYTVDVFCDQNSTASLAIPRKRLAVRGGEVSRGVIERNSQLESLAKRLAEALKVSVPITIQFRKSAAGFVAMEINARIGGGLPLTISAGGKWPLWILQMACGLKSKIQDEVRDGLIISRHDESVFIKREAKAKPKPDLSKVKLIIFDMDDTLYPEKEFVFSAYRAVSKYVLNKFGIFIEDELRRRFSDGQRGDLFSLVLNDLGVDFKEEDIKEIVNVYRSHKPEISPYSDTELIPGIKSGNYKIGLITDGWSSVQRNKWKALKLEKYFDHVVFTDDFGLEFWKPSTKAFAYICEEAGVKFEEAVYIADNPDKDFKAPNELGMKSLRIRRNGGESSLKEVYEKSFDADYEIDSLTDLMELLKISRDSKINLDIHKIT